MALHWMPRSYYAKWREGNELLYSVAETKVKYITCQNQLQLERWHEIEILACHWSLLFSPPAGGGCLWWCYVEDLGSSLVEMMLKTSSLLGLAFWAFYLPASLPILHLLPASIHPTHHIILSFSIHPCFLWKDNPSSMWKKVLLRLKFYQHLLMIFPKKQGSVETTGLLCY